GERPPPHVTGAARSDEGRTISLALFNPAESRTASVSEIVANHYSTRITRRGGSRVSSRSFADGRGQDHDAKHFREHPKYRCARCRYTSPSILLTLSPVRIKMLIDFPASRNGSLRSSLTKDRAGGPPWVSSDR